MRNVLTYAVLLVSAHVFSADPAGASWSGDEVEGVYYRSLVETFAAKGYQPRFAVGRSEDDLSDTFALSGLMRDKVEISRIDPIEDGSVPFQEAFRVRTLDEAVGEKWKIIFGLDRVSYPIEQGDHLLFTFWLRGVERPDAGPIKYFLWSADRDTKKRLGHSGGIIPYGDLDAADAWLPVYVHLQVPADNPSGNWYIEFHLNGAGAQTFDIGGPALLDFGAANPEGDFVTPVRIDWDYGGRNEDAAWREEAAGRIRESRMREMRIRVLDRDGAPVSGASVAVKQRQHAFPWGVTFSPQEWPDGQRPNAAKFTFLQDFLNQVTYVQFCWRGWSGQWGEANKPEYLVEAVEKALGNGLTVHAHALIWHKYGFAPFTRDDSRDEILTRIRSHWENVLTRPGIAGKLHSIDVVNHPVGYCEIWRDHGMDLMVKEFQWARELAPDAILYINEGAHPGDGAFNQYLELIDKLLSMGAPIDGVGLMSHYKLNHLVDIETVFEGLARIDAIGKKHGRPLVIKISEFDVDSFDLTDTDRAQLQADYFRDFMTAAFSHPSVESFTFWSLWGHDFKTQSIFAKDGSDRPAAAVLKRLLRDTWWTSTSGDTDADGRLRVEAFLGDHDVAVTHDGAVQQRRVTVGEDDVEVVIPLE